MNATLHEKTKSLKSNFNDIITAEFLSYLVASGFFTAPASTKHHGSNEGGLFEHSMKVAQKLHELTERNNLVWENSRSPRLVGMFHDLCKIESYVQEGEKYKWNPNQLLDGHGSKSVVLLQQYIKLTEEEILCIRWHMGAFDNNSLDFYRKAVRKYPNILWTHHADMLVSQCMGA